jgi:hypothetical protein
VVDPLNNVADAPAALIENNAVSVIDMAVAVRSRGDELTAQWELPRHGPDVVFKIQVHSNLTCFQVTRPSGCLTFKHKDPIYAVSISFQGGRYGF